MAESKQRSDKSASPYERTHPRLMVEVEIQVKSLPSRTSTETKTPDAAPVPAQLMEISPGGALLVVQDELGVVGDSIELVLPHTDQGLRVPGEITRAARRDDDRLIAVRFTLTETVAQEELNRVCAAMLCRGGGGRRAHARVAHHMEIWYGDQAELRAILQNISQGGLLMVTVDDPPKMDETVQVVIPTPPADELILMARVVHFETHAETDWVGLQFEAISNETRGRVESLLYLLLDSANIH